MNTDNDTAADLEAQWANIGAMGEEPEPAPVVEAVAPKHLVAEMADAATADVEAVEDAALFAVHAAEVVAPSSRGLTMVGPEPAMPPPPASRPRVSYPAGAQPYIAVLEKRLAAGTRSAAATLESVFTTIPRDQVARVGAVAWVPTPTGIMARVADLELSPSHYALSQIAERAKVPGEYLRGLCAHVTPDEKTDESLAAAIEANAWRHSLAAQILTTHYAHDPKRALVRSVGGQMRGWLSSSYRRLDSRPLVEALCAEAAALGAVPYEGAYTETRVSVKMVVPEIIEPLPGEYMLVGVEWCNSDYGHGVHSIRPFWVRVVCTNGLTRENTLKQVHLGRQLSDDIELSDRTHRLDNATSVSALRDVVRASLGPARTDSIRAELEAAAAMPTTAGALRARVAKSQSKGITKAIVDAYESADVVNLPPGENVWRASNAISWIARNCEDQETKIDLERLAGAVLR